MQSCTQKIYTCIKYIIILKLFKRKTIECFLTTGTSVFSGDESGILTIIPLMMITYYKSTTPIFEIFRST
jgi:hypothetical protein